MKTKYLKLLKSKNHILWGEVNEKGIITFSQSTCKLYGIDPEMPYEEVCNLYKTFKIDTIVEYKKDDQMISFNISNKDHPSFFDKKSKELKR